MSVNYQAEMIAFEKVFPMPEHCTRFAAGYAPTEYSAWQAQVFCNKWEGWKARAELKQTNINEQSEKVKHILSKALRGCEGDLGFLAHILPDIVEEIVLVVNEHDG